MVGARSVARGVYRTTDRVVVIRDGVVFLTGEVGSDAEKQKALQLAMDTLGVRDVQANLTSQKSQRKYPTSGPLRPR